VQGEPPFISLRDVAKKSDAEFAGLKALTCSQYAPAQSLAAFVAGLPQHLPWQQLVAASEQRRNELVAQLRPGAGGKPRVVKAKK
jgi:hypothetical protein